MTDRELLELAAKAAGMVGYEYKVSDVSGHEYMAVDEGGSQSEYWSPLTDDGDALRLAVKLEIDLCYGANYVIADGVQEPTVNNANDPCSATRRAIVRAAVEVGRVEP
jgi:hypothetical protein